MNATRMRKWRRTIWAGRVLKHRWKVWRENICNGRRTALHHIAVKQRYGTSILTLPLFMPDPGITRLPFHVILNPFRVRTTVWVSRQFGQPPESGQPFIVAWPWKFFISSMKTLLFPRGTTCETRKLNWIFEPMGNSKWDKCRISICSNIGKIQHCFIRITTAVHGGKTASNKIGDTDRHNLRYAKPVKE